MVDVQKEVIELLANLNRLSSVLIAVRMLLIKRVEKP